MDYNPEISAKPSPFDENGKIAIAEIKPAQNSHSMNHVPPPFQKNGQRIPLNPLARPKPKGINLYNQPEEEEKEPVKAFVEAEGRDDTILNSTVEERELPEKLKEEPVMRNDFMSIQEEPYFTGYTNQLYQFHENKGQSQGSYREEQKCDLANQNNLVFKADEGYMRKQVSPIDEDKPEDAEQHNGSCDRHNMSDNKIEPVHFNLVDISAPPITLGASYLHQLKTLRKKGNGIKCFKPAITPLNKNPRLRRILNKLIEFCKKRTRQKKPLAGI